MPSAVEGSFRLLVVHRSILPGTCGCHALAYDLRAIGTTIAVVKAVGTLVRSIGGIAAAGFAASGYFSNSP